MSYQRISLEIADKVAVLKFKHPEVLNAIGGQMVGELTQAVREIADPSRGARCVLLTGEGRAFCSGANLQDESRGANQGAGDTLRGGYHPLLLAIRDLEMPVVSAVNGVAAGVGMSFAAMADIVCASKNAYFLQAFARIGLIPDGGSTYMLPRLIGKARAMEMALLGERVPAVKALEWGLINRVVPDAELMSTAMALAGELAAGPASLGLTRQTIWASLDAEWSEQLHREAVGQSVAGRTEDFAEGVAAFLQKRPAQFKGR